MNTERITRKNLENLLPYFCKVMGLEPFKGYTNNKAHVGGVYLDGAYGGWTLHKVMNEGGGVRTLLRRGHVPARELFQAMHDAMEGVEIREREAVSA